MFRKIYKKIEVRKKKETHFFNDSLESRFFNTDII